jgi:hypothetical protein
VGSKERRIGKEKRGVGGREGKEGTLRKAIKRRDD